MKTTVVLVSVLFVAMPTYANPAQDAKGITTNLVVYTDFHNPSNTSHYFATKLSLTVRDGLIVACENQGEFDLFNGLAAAESVAERERRVKELKRLLKGDKLKVRREIKADKKRNEGD